MKDRWLSRIPRGYMDFLGVALSLIGGIAFALIIAAPWVFGLIVIIKKIAG